jgi:RNA polymerase sigma-70 factor (sigma-E family)
VDPVGVTARAPAAGRRAREHRRQAWSGRCRRTGRTGLNVSHRATVGEGPAATGTSAGIVLRGARIISSFGEEFTEWLAAETPQLLRTAYVMTCNRHDAWDLVQETVFRVASRWDRLKDQEPGAYASTVMARLNIDRFRRARKELLFPLVTDSARRQELPAVIDDDGLDENLVKAIKRLTPKQRTAIVLRYVNDLDTNTIAQEMNCSAATVRTHLSRGLETLRQSYHEVRQPYQGALSHE